MLFRSESVVLTHEQAVALPLNGRDYAALTLLTTGVRQSASSLDLIWTM